MTVRKNTTVVVTGVIDGSKKVKVRQKGDKPKVAVVESRRIHERVLNAALNIAGGDMKRLDWEGATVVDGVITEIRVLNRPKGR